MFQSLGYSGVAPMAATWLSNLSPILIFLAAIPLALTLAGLGLALMGSRGSDTASGPPSNTSSQ